MIEPSFTRRFRVRHYECDAFGHLNNANYLRYMQETALDATADVGWDLERYAQINRLWIIRENTIEFLQPLKYNEEVDIQTWVHDIERVRSTRQYLFQRPQTNETIAKAHSNWVFVDSESQQLARIPDDVRHAYLPNNRSTTEKSPEKFPKITPPPPNVFSICQTVQWHTVDAVQHLNNASYLNYIEDAATGVGEHYQWSMERILSSGFQIIARKIQIQYLQAAKLGEELKIETWLSDVRRATCHRNFYIKRASDGELLAHARILFVFFNTETLKPMRAPREILEDFAENIV